MSSQYKEIFDNGGGMTLSNTLSTGGIGCNLKAGLIYRPIDMVRFGFSIHSPIVYLLSDNNSANMDYFISNTNNGNFDTPGATNTYLLSTPWKFNSSVALILGQKGLISGEYDISFNKESYFMDKTYSTQNYTEENTGIPALLQNVQTYKIGAEYKYSPNLTFRAGYANVSGGTSPNADLLLQPYTTRTDVQYFLNNNTNFYTLGFGYREAAWFIDFAFVNKTVNETFYPYNTNKMVELNPSLVAAIPASVSTTSNNVVITIGLKF